MGQGKLVRNIVTENYTIDFNNVSDGAGVFHLVIKNEGNSIAVIDDNTRQEIKPGQTFIIESPVAIIDTVLPLTFIDEPTKKNKLVIGYIIGIC